MGVPQGFSWGSGSGSLKTRKRMVRGRAQFAPHRVLRHPVAPLAVVAWIFAFEEPQYFLLPLAMLPVCFLWFAYTLWVYPGDRLARREARLRRQVRVRHSHAHAVTWGYLEPEDVWKLLTYAGLITLLLYYLYDLLLG
jgi:hypothetical protein